jgi:hypothetical protein
MKKPYNVNSALRKIILLITYFFLLLNCFLASALNFLTNRYCILDVLAYKRIHTTDFLLIISLSEKLPVDILIVTAYLINMQ